jgi:hypothetical protein
MHVLVKTGCFKTGCFNNARGWNLLKSCVSVSSLPDVAVFIELPALFPIKHKGERLLLMSKDTASVSKPTASQVKYFVHY